MYCKLDPFCQKSRPQLHIFLEIISVVFTSTEKSKHEMSLPEIFILKLLENIIDSTNSYEKEEDY
jgi:hypothetical protein